MASAEEYNKELERLESLQRTGAISRNEFFLRWIFLEQQHSATIG